MRMPIKDGYEATAEIRQLEGGNIVKIIALTASAFSEQHANIINAGCDAVLHKPFQAPEIFTILAKQLGVKFIYEDKPEAVPSAQLITVEMLTALPLTLRQQLHEAAMNLDTEETDAVIAKIRPLASNVAQGLQELANSYQFEQIIHLIEAAEGQ